MHDFAYVCPDSLEEALLLLAGSGEETKLLAGGTCLIPQMRDHQLLSPYRRKRMVRPERLLSLRRLSWLRERTQHGNSWCLGALTTMADLAGPAGALDLPLLAHVAGRIASPEIRQRATLGGNLCNASPAADLLAPLLVLGAKLHLVSASSDRWLRLQDFYLGPHRTAARADEVLVGLTIPVSVARCPWGATAYATRPHMGITLAAAACVIEETKGARLGRLAVTLATGRPIEVEWALIGPEESDREAVGELVDRALAGQGAKARGCHYAAEHPDVPPGYLQYRAVLAAQEAFGVALSGSANSGGLNR